MTIPRLLYQQVYATRPYAANNSIVVVKIFRDFIDSDYKISVFIDGIARLPISKCHAELTQEQARCTAGLLLYEVAHV